MGSAVNEGEMDAPLSAFPRHRFPASRCVVFQKAGKSDACLRQLAGIARGQTHGSQVSGVGLRAWMETPKCACLSKPSIRESTKLGWKHRGQEVPLC